MTALIGPHRFGTAFCWFCAGRLPPTFTTILRSGVRVPVHFGCRLEAEAVAGRAVLVEDQEEQLRAADWMSTEQLDVLQRIAESGLEAAIGHYKHEGSNRELRMIEIWQHLLDELQRVKPS